MNYKIIPIGRAKDIRGQRFNKLIVIDRVENKGKKVQWLCQCDCGNYTIVDTGHLKDGHVQSCGCLKHSPLDDISGQRFGKLTVIQYDHTEGKGHTYWKCICDCGTEKIVRKDGLISGAVVSCGCHKAQQTSKLFSAQLEGQRFGTLTVKKRCGHDKYNKALWLCECDCGNIITTTTHALRYGSTKSCGCIKSHGERIIRELLNNNSIKFEQQKTFESCRFIDTNALAKFDFWINNNYLIEFDGRQHYLPSKYNNQGWNTEEKFINTVEHDKFKNQWCKENNIPLIRIPYWKLDTLCIEDLLLETTQFLMEK